MDFKIEDTLSFKIRTFYSPFLLNLENCLLQFINGKLFTSNQFINKNCFKGQMS